MTPDEYLTLKEATSDIETMLDELTSHLAPWEKAELLAEPCDVVNVINPEYVVPFRVYGVSIPFDPSNLRKPTASRA